MRRERISKGGMVVGGYRIGEAGPAGSAAGSARPRPVALFAALLTLILVSGCVVGPDYQAPPQAAPEAFGHADEGGEAVSFRQVAVPEAAWWERLGDPVLVELVERAREANTDLRIAEANVRAARALLGVERSGLLPSVGASAGAERREVSEATLGGAAGQPGVDRTDIYYSAALDASWELDLFGRIRRSVEAQAARYDATLAERRAVFVAVAGEVGRTYAELRGAQTRLAVARANVANQEESLELVEVLLDAGRGTDLEVQQARAQLETTRASVPALEVAEARAVHRLAVLTGEQPTALADLLAAPELPLRPAASDEDAAPDTQPSYLPPVPDTIAIGDPASLLRRRPDVEAAERRLAAATAEIGVAVADLFPRVSLSASAGALATSLGDLGDSANRTTSIGPFLSVPLFDRGALRDRVRATEAGADAALAAYDATVLVALEETENALVRLSRSRTRQAHLRRAEEAATRAADLARQRYRAGLDSFLTVLDAEGRALAAEDAVALEATETAAAFVALYRAVGGGWEVDGEGGRSSYSAESAAGAP